MITGINKVYVHDGTEYHVQAEDLGEASAAFEIRVYQGGGVRWLKRLPYQELLDQGLPKRELEAALHDRMEKTVLTVEAAIAKGKIA